MMLRQIDRLVYELYGLTEDEIRIVEGGHALSRVPGIGFSVPGLGSRNPEP
jgi:hypothetical protein